MTSAEYAEYAQKSGLTPNVLRAAVVRSGDRPVLEVSQKLYHYAKQVCREAFGEDFYSRVGLAIVSSGKYGWKFRGDE